MTSTETDLFVEGRVKNKKSAQKWMRFLKGPQKLVSNFRIKVRAFIYKLRYHSKRHYHLYLMLKHEQTHFRAKTIFSAQDRTARKNDAEDLYGSLSRRLVPLCRTMENIVLVEDCESRFFRGKFVKTVRLYRKLSREQLCLLLNSHQNLHTLGHRHQSLWEHFPFKPEFIEQFEERTSTIREEITQGLFFGAGFPTGSFSQWIAQVCGAKAEHDEFLRWYQNHEGRKWERKKQGF